MVNLSLWYFAHTNNFDSSVCTFIAINGKDTKYCYYKSKPRQIYGYIPQYFLVWSSDLMTEYSLIHREFHLVSLFRSLGLCRFTGFD